MAQNYSNESISSLKGADRVRKRPAVIFGSDGLEGCEHAFFEIFSNAIDEAREGFGSVINIVRDKDMSLTIEDFGRGMPVDYNKNEKRFNWELLFTEMYAGGKYNTNDGESYEFSLGLNGLGLCATQYASAFMKADIRRDGKRFMLNFEKGLNVGGLNVEEYKGKQTGTKITFLPDLDVFTEINIDIDYFDTVIKRQAVINKGVTFNLSYITDEGEEKREYLYENGIEGYLEELTEGAELLMPISFWEGEREGRDRADKPSYKVRLSAAISFSNRFKFCEYYHNSSFLEYGGAPEKALRSAMVAQVDAYLKQNGKYLKNESKVSFVDIEDSLIFISSSFSTVTSYENQTKKAINNKFIQQAMAEFLKHNLEVFFLENPDEAAAVTNQILINKRSREDAEKTRLNLRKKLSGTIDMSNRVDQFVDCRSKDKTKREIYIVEGKSAMGSVKMGRDSEFQAVIPVRGKILNCLKADYARIFQSEIIIGLIKVLGCGVDVKSASNKELSNFNIDNLRFSKIVICTDADVDGFQIRTLILAMIYRLMPKLISAGFVYIAESPLFEITTKADTYFAYNEQEKTKALSEIGEDKYKIQRSKGLGENDADMMWLTTMNPLTRRLIKVETFDELETKVMFDTLLGEDIDSRKAIIEEQGHLYREALDVS